MPFRHGSYSAKLSSPKGVDKHTRLVSAISEVQISPICKKSLAFFNFYNFY